MKIVRKVLLAAAGVALTVLLVVSLVAVVTFVSRHPLRTFAGAAAGLVGALVLGVILGRLAPRIPKATILELDLAVPPVEDGSQPKLAALAPGKPLSVSEVVETLERAARDKRVAGLVVRPRFTLAPLAAIDELRTAIANFATSGKFTVAVVDSFGEGSPANGAYLLATACAEITVQESGYVGLAPLAVESNFYPDLLARIGIAVEVFGRGKYKSAPNQLTERGFTDPDREQTGRVLEMFWSHVVGQVAEARKLTTDVVRELADQGPLLAGEALDAGLVDRIAYPDVVIEEIKRRTGPKAELLYLGVYKKRAGKGRGAGKPVQIAVIRAAGEIRRSAGGLPIGLGGGNVLTPDTIVPAIRAAAKDKKVKAVVLRIDSPGGSALASDSIWHELMRLREAGKPLVASMASVAASGGYYMASAADRIVAQPTTVTGSIGVFGLQPVLAEAKAKLHLQTDEIHTGAEPTAFSFNRPSSLTRRHRMDVQLDHIYGQFTQRVADGRHLELSQVLEVAQGRVWTGTDAVGVGLVDDLGGLDRAVSVALELCGAPTGSRAKIKSYPRKSGPLRTLRRRKGDSSDAVDAVLGLRPIAGPAGAFVHIGCDPRRYWVH